MNKEDWEVKRLGEVIDFQNGFAFQSSKFKESGTPIIRIGNIQNGNINIEDVVFCKKEDYKENLDKYIIKYDDILIAMSGATTGKVGISKFSKEFYLNQRVGRIRTLHDIATMYIYYFLQIKAEKTLMLAEGAAQPNISTTQIKNFLISIPPLSIQTQIVAELDELNAILDKKRKQLEELDTLAQATFYDMFGDPVLNEKGWETEIMDAVAPSKASREKVASHKGKYWILNLDMIKSQTGEILKYQYKEIEKIGNSTHKFDSTNVLYSKLRPYLNKVVLPRISGYATTELVPLKPNSKFLDRWFFSALLRSDSFVSYIKEKTKGAKMPRTDMKIFKKFPIILPPLSLQHKFAERIEAIEAQKELINQSIKEVQLLFDYTMDKYFN